MNEFTEEEIMNIEAFCSNEKMYEAVKKGVLVGLYSYGVLQAGKKHDPMKNAALRMAFIAIENPVPDEIIGQNVRAIAEGLNAFQNGFNDLLKIKSNKATEDKEPVNQGV